jgi:hypothetical protein
MLTGLTVRAVAAILERLHDRYAPTVPALIAMAVKLEWITVPIWTMHADPTPPPSAPYQCSLSPPKSRHRRRLRWVLTEMQLNLCCNNCFCATTKKSASLKSKPAPILVMY